MGPSEPITLKQVQPSQWHAWFTMLKIHAEGLKLWQDIDPDQNEQESDAFEIPKHPTPESAVEKAQEYRRIIGEETTIFDIYKIMGQEYMFAAQQHIMTANKAYVIRNWIANTVEPSMLESAYAYLEEQHPKRVTLRRLVKEIKRQYAPSQSSIRKGAQRRRRGR
ncbi:hypothetical protein ED733_003066 [Metarhizium rileyi]|uniref:DUF4219 domain-containing protein n=1 Tax=Metarhizium rileyi (strain RCEF 4871) TaxID=1649241 RepID=A0A5C6G6L9_METRR|nr:hypothetical protein ED733_003066 [Metarhizium rileyi]